MATMRIPQWKTISENIGGPLFKCADEQSAPTGIAAPDMEIVGRLAVFHLNACLNASIEATRSWQPAVAICLIRQCVEALTIVDVSLQPAEYRDALFIRWREGKETVGSLRGHLERDIWPGYGRGLWDEPWADFFSQLARAVQPYAHYSLELSQWQIGLIFPNAGEKMIAHINYTNPDPTKASRTALLQSLVIWVLGRVLLKNRNSDDVLKFSEPIDRLGKAIGRSDLLFKSKSWAAELAPHVWFTTPDFSI